MYLVQVIQQICVGMPSGTPWPREPLFLTKPSRWQAKPCQEYGSCGGACCKSGSPGFFLFAAIQKKNEQTHTVLLVRNGLVWLGIILEANAADPLGALLSRAMVDKVELEVRLQMRWASLMWIHQKQCDFIRGYGQPGRKDERDIMKHIYIYICDLDIFALGDYAMYIYICDILDHLGYFRMKCPG